MTYIHCTVNIIFIKATDTWSM